MRSPWSCHVLTLFPDIFPGALDVSVLSQARSKGIWDLHVHDIRDFSLDKHKSVDDEPYGGGAGMVMRADVVGGAMDHVSRTHGVKTWYVMSPRGRQIDQSFLYSFAQLSGPIGLLCGRFEGIDERIYEAHDVTEISIGDFVMTGGELAAMCVLDATIRLLDGVVGDKQSLVDESFQDGLLEYPQYTRPAEWQGKEVPVILLSGHHEKIRQWRQEKSMEITAQRRPDLWKKYQEKRG